MNIANIQITGKGIKFVNKYGNAINNEEAMSKIYVRVNNIFNDFVLLLLRIVSNCIPSHVIRKSFYKAFGMKIGKGSYIHMRADFFYPKGIEIGKDSIIGSHAFLDGRGKITIGDHVDIASDVMIYNSEHDINDPGFKAIVKNVEIEDYVFIGPRVIILPGVKIGKGSILAAGCVVTNDVKEYEVVAGIPAKTIGERKNKNPNYILGRPRLFQ